MYPPLPTRKLGKNGPEIVTPGLGLLGISGFYGAPESDEDRFAFLDRAFELGATNWDTADVYADSESLIGTWFARTGKREEIFLATKYAMKIGIKNFIIDSSPEYTKKGCEQCLKRLGVQYIDLLYCNRVDNVTPIEKTVEAMVDLKNEGKIRYIGLCEISADTLRRACKVHHIDAVQLEYSPFTIDLEHPQIALLRACRELGVGIIAYSPLSRGFVTGKYRSRDDFERGDFRLHLPRFSAENFPKNLALVDALACIAKRKGCTASQLTLAWLMAQGDDIIPIPGTKKIKYLEENISAMKVKLTKEEELEIRTLVENAEIHGKRYTEALYALCLVDSAPLHV